MQFSRAWFYFLFSAHETAGRIILYTVTRLLRTGILKPVEMAVARQRFLKHISTTIMSCDHCRTKTQQRYTSRHVMSMSAVTSRDIRRIVRSDFSDGSVRRLYLENWNTSRESTGSQTSRSMRPLWTVALGGDMGGGGAHCCKPLRSKADLVLRQ
jgi:hypothetical protein